MKTSKKFGLTKELLFLSSIIFFAIISIILGLVNTKTDDFDEVKQSLMDYKDSLEVVGIIELVINSLLICYLLYIAIKHNISKSNGGIDV